MTPPVSDLSRRFRIPDFRDTMPSKQISRARFLFLHTQEKFSGDLPDSRLLRPRLDAPRRISETPGPRPPAPGPPEFTRKKNPLRVNQRPYVRLRVNDYA